MAADALRKLIDSGNVAGVRAALDADPKLALTPIHWHLNQDNTSDPLHYVCDAVGQGWLTNGAEAEIAQLLLDHGARIEGSPGQESALIAAASLGAESVVPVLLAAGADPEATAVFGACALHWAAWTGAAPSVRSLLEAGASVVPRCSEFEATPLFWAVHGYGPRGPSPKRGQVEAAELLLAAGADPATTNGEGVFALELSRQCDDDAMTRLLERALAGRA